MAEYATLAAVDLGSNSFHCQIARIVDDQLYPLDSLREPVRLGAGLSAEKLLSQEAQERALACLCRFGERLRGFDPHTVRAVGTNTLRVAKNARAFLKRARVALGFPIEVVAGREEARLIYLGVAHELPLSTQRRLVIDIGGGSTELIIGSGYKPQKLASLYMGCVSHSLRYFPDGRVTRSGFKQAEIAARAELQPVASAFSSRHWQRALGASGTIRSIAEVLEKSGMSDGPVTLQGLDALRATLLRAGHLDRLSLAGLRADRRPVLPGGLAILRAVVTELGIGALVPATGAMRQGVLFDLLGRVHRQDMRDVTVAQFMQRYHVDAVQARRVSALAHKLRRTMDAREEDGERVLSQLRRAAKLHEIGISVAYAGYHRHGAYILENADMPGFSRDEQTALALLVGSHRRSLKKVAERLEGSVDWESVLALRLAALVYRGRTELELPSISARSQGRKFRVSLGAEWLARNPLTMMALQEEAREWERIGFDLVVSGLEALETTAEVNAALQPLT
jgi:exopolyphosphatase / guanosine-5'-triphosphate,3'-diphosphate pyrophosphatase